MPTVLRNAGGADPADAGDFTPDRLAAEIAALAADAGKLLAHGGRRQIARARPMPPSGWPTWSSVAPSVDR